MKIKTILLAALAATALVSARADEVTIAGSTSGSFSASGTNSNQKLTFNGGSFDQSTFLNFGAVGGMTDNNFGTMTLGFSANPGQTYSGTFDLFITFTAPAGITGGQDATYTALVQGTLGPAGTPGGVSINFASGGAQTFTFASGANSGSFTLSLDNLSISPGRTVAITGSFTGSQNTTNVPDGGATVALLGVALVGVAALRRKLATA